MLADQGEISQDSVILDGFGMEDLNIDTINSFRNRLGTLKPQHPWLSLDNTTFLYKVKLFRWSFILHLNLVELIQERAAVSSHFKK